MGSFGVHIHPGYINMYHFQTDERLKLPRHKMCQALSELLRPHVLNTE